MSRWIFCFKRGKILKHVRERIPFLMLSVSSLFALWKLPLLILRMSFFDVLLMVDVVLVVFRYFWIVSPSFNFFQ